MPRVSDGVITNTIIMVVPVYKPFAGFVDIREPGAQLTILLTSAKWFKSYHHGVETTQHLYTTKKRIDDWSGVEYYYRGAASVRASRSDGSWYLLTRPLWFTAHS